jgi:hypothetical protein
VNPSIDGNDFLKKSSGYQLASALKTSSGSPSTMTPRIHYPSCTNASGFSSSQNSGGREGIAGLFLHVGCNSTMVLQVAGRPCPVKASSTSPTSTSGRPLGATLFVSCATYVGTGLSPPTRARAFLTHLTCCTSLFEPDKILETGNKELR